MNTPTVTRLFSDIDGRTIELFGYISGMDRAEFFARFPSSKGRKFDSKRMQVARDSAGHVWPVTRAIAFKKTSKLHKCNSLCLDARGPNCECKCGGKNHGRGDAGAQTGFFEENTWTPEQTGFSVDPDARAEEVAADFALDFMGGPMELGGEQIDLLDVGRGEVPMVRDRRQTNLF
jgi:hypothetical protein